MGVATLSRPATVLPKFATDYRRLAAHVLLAVAGACLLARWPSPASFPIEYLHAGRFALACLTYLAAARACLCLSHTRVRAALFALTNLAAICLFFDTSSGRRRLVFFMGAYVAMVVWHFAMLRLFAQREGRWPWLAFWSPIAALAAIRGLSLFLNPLRAALPGIFLEPPAVFFIGLSYMAFRLSHLALEVRNRVAPLPDVWEYLGFAFFLPTLAVGPINPYHVHQRSLAQPDRTVTPVGRSCLRIVTGAAKFYFLGNIFQQLSYSGLLLDGQPHPPVDLLLAAVCYHLYLYTNFSGFCDIAIGGAGLLGIQVRENFRNPLASRSVQEYWTRWHITLSTYLRDVVFSPVSRLLIDRFGVRHTNHAIAAAIGVVFLLMGLWHGVGWNYLIHGAFHAAGVATNHYYTVWLKKRLGREGLKAYHENRWITALAVSVTFLYVTTSLFFFANDMTAIRQIFRALR